MIRIVWNWLAWQFYKGNANKLLAMSQEVAQSMDARQKLDYALHAAWLAHELWYCPDGINRSGVLLHSIEAFKVKQTRYVDARDIKKRAKHFKLIARGKLPPEYKMMPSSITPDMRELAYVFEIITYMLGMVYPEHDHIFSDVAKQNRCDDSEALTRIATSIVASVATAYGHAYGVRAYGRKYREMIDYGRELNE